MPFENDYLDAVTMLAVFEHLEFDRLENFFSEVSRVLKPGGICVLTTPSPWSEWLLKLLSKIRIISAEELAGHKISLTTAEIKSVLMKSGFKNVKNGFLNAF